MRQLEKNIELSIVTLKVLFISYIFASSYDIIFRISIWTSLYKVITLTKLLDDLIWINLERSVDTYHRIPILGGLICTYSYLFCSEFSHNYQEIFLLNYTCVLSKEPITLQPERNQVTEGNSKLNNESLHDCIKIRAALLQGGATEEC